MYAIIGSIPSTANRRAFLIATALGVDDMVSLDSGSFGEGLGSIKTNFPKGGWGMSSASGLVEGSHGDTGLLRPGHFRHDGICFSRLRSWEGDFGIST
jgi:hypothetical protein